MSKPVRLFCLLLSLLFILAQPFLVPSGSMLESAQEALLDETYDSLDDWEDINSSSIFDFLFPSVKAESDLEPLPMDFSGGRKPIYESYTLEGYEDPSISLKLETLDRDKVVWRIARVKIVHPWQLRSELVESKYPPLISSMAKKKNAVIAINANYITNDPVKTSFEFRMGKKIRAKLNKAKDLLVTDENGDFHLFVKSAKEEVKAFTEAGHTIINAFTFGPALVKDGELLQLDPKYGYHPDGKEPRMAIGQTGPLEYIMVLAEGRSAASEGVTHQTLAEFMLEQGCLQAFNLDGGNSATMVFNEGFYQRKTIGNERPQSDMIYFATLAGAAE